MAQIKIGSLDWLLRRLACSGYKIAIDYQHGREGGVWRVQVSHDTAESLGALHETLWKAVNAIYKRTGLK